MMDWLRILFSTKGTLAPRDFMTAVIAVYVAYLASQTLISGPIVGKASIAPFVLAQGACLWAWYAVHAKRLSDAGQARWPAVVVTCIFAFVTLIIIVLLAIFLALLSGKPSDGGAMNNAIGFYVLVAMSAVLFGVIDPTGFAPLIFGILVVMFVPGILAIAFTIWTGTRPRLALPAPATLTPLPAPP